MFFISKEKIDSATAQDYRQYFVGHLMRPQILPHMDSMDVEVGISNYTKYTVDTPHLHTTTADMIYILKGEYQFFLIGTKEKQVAHEGDFVAIPPNTAYASKAKAGTIALFVKSCKGNDKVNVEDIDSEVQEWMNTEI